MHRKRFPLPFIVLLPAAACEGPFVPPPQGPPPPPPPPAVATVQLEPDSATVIAGDTLPLQVTLRDSSGAVLLDRAVIWQTADPSIATVTGTGVVQGISVGNTTVRAAAGGHAAVVTVFITPVYFTALSTGGAHACAAANNQLSYCWGNNAHEETGTESGVLVEATPRAVASTTRFSDLASGGDHSCALSATGAAFCWGRNDEGQLGRGSVGDPALPAPVVGAPRFTTLAAGGGHTCALTATGVVYCWGLNASGQLGDGALGTAGETPQIVHSDSAFASIAAGGSHTCALTAAGAAFCWGSNATGQVGDGTRISGFNVLTTPTAVVGGLSFARITAGGSHTCALTADGLAYCWGANGAGQLGTGTGDSLASSPQPVTGGLTFRAITAGGTHTCALTADSLAYCWGDDSDGQLDDSLTTTQPTAAPVPVSGGLRFADVRAGASYTCGLTGSLVVYCWGLGVQGQLGQITPRSSPVPLRVAGQP